jgi:hypothetical protein
MIMSMGLTSNPYVKKKKMNLQLLDFLKNMTEEKKILAMQIAMTAPTITGVDSRPRNLKLAFVGGPVTRFQYLDFVYYLKSNMWIQDDNEPMILFKYRSYITWKDLMVGSNIELAPFEECDCYRPKGLFNISDGTENRYFKDEELGNYITFIMNSGSLGAHGHWDPEEVYESRVRFEL